MNFNYKRWTNWMMDLMLEEDGLTPKIKPMSSSELTKWTDHSILLANHSKQLLVALYNVKKNLENESLPSNEIWFRGGSMDLSFPFRGQNIVPESAARPSFPRMSILLDSNIVALQKSVLKKFPDVDLGKAENIIQVQSELFIKELKPYYDLFWGVADFVELAIHHLLAISKVKFSSNQIFEMSAAFLDLLKGLVKVLLLQVKIPPIKKFVLFLYQRSYKFMYTDGRSSPGWSSILLFLAKYEKPFDVLSNLLEPISLKIGVMLSSYQVKLKEKIVANSAVLKNTGTWVALPSLYDAHGSHSTGCDSCQALFESIVIGYLVQPDNAQIADLFKVALEWGHFIKLCRDEYSSIQTQVDMLLKDQPKLSKLKTVKQETTQVYSSCFFLHKDRRDFLIGELHSFAALMHSRNHVPNLFDLVDALSAAKDEIVWYFDYFDRDAHGEIKQGKKETKYTDVRVIELLWLFKYIWGALSISKDTYISKIKKSVPKLWEKIKMYMEQLRNEIDTSTVEGEIVIKMLKIFSSPPKYDEFREIGTLYRQFEIAAGLNPKLNSLILSTLGKHFEEFLNLSKWIDSFEECMYINSNLKGLFFKQAVLFEHAKQILEEQGERLKYVIAIGMVAGDFNDNASDLWPFEAPNLSTHTTCFATEFFSIIGQYSAIIAHNLAIQTIKLVSTLPSDGFNLQGDAKKTKGKKEKFKLGQGSKFLNPDPLVLEIEEEKCRLRNLMYLGNFESIPVYDVEFQPFEFFLDALSSKFRMFLNGGIYVHDIVLTKESTGNVVSDDIMSFDIKRPSVFYSEVKEYLNCMVFLHDVSGINVVCVLRDIWSDQVDLEKAKRISGGLDNDLVFHISQKRSRERGKAVNVNPIQPFLVTLSQWYSEFIGSKALSDTTVYSSFRQSFSNKQYSSIQADFFTDHQEIKALCKLIGLQGVQFFNEKLSRMTAVLIENLKKILEMNSGSLEKMRLSGDEYIIRELCRKMDFSAFLAVANTIGFISKFRESLNNQFASIYESKYSEVVSLVKQLKNVKFENSQSVQTIANQIGISDENDGVLLWALSSIPSKSEASLWKLLPMLYSSAIWTKCYDKTTIYNPNLDTIQNNLDLVFSSFSHILGPLFKVFGLSSEIQAYHEEFVGLISSLLLSGLNLVEEKELSTSIVKTVVGSLHKYVQSDSKIAMDRVEHHFPYGVMKSSLLHTTGQGNTVKLQAYASRDDDLAL